MQTRTMLPRILFLAVILVQSGCGQFFVPDTGGGGGGTGSNADIYVANNTTANIAGFSIASSGLTTLSNSPYAIGVSPNALAITPSNSFVYTSTLAGGIFAYTVGSGGALTVANSGSAVVSGISPVSLSVDATGNWLLAVDPTPMAYVFAINTSNGTLTSQGSVPLAAGSPYKVTIAPNNNLVYVSLGTGGVAILTFNAATGVLTNTNTILKPKQSLNADQGLVVNPASTFLYVAETGVNGVRALSIGTNGALTELTGSPYSTGTGPSAVFIDSTGSYLYVTNTAANTVSAFLASSSGALTGISGSPFATGTQPIGIAEDNTHTYIAVVCAGGTPDLQVFTIDTTTPGALANFKTAATGTDPTNPLAIVAAN